MPQPLVEGNAPKGCSWDELIPLWLKNINHWSRLRAMTGIQRAIDIFDAISRGAVTNLARAIRRSPQEVDKWLRRGWVPAKYCVAISQAVAAAIPLARFYGLSVDVARPVTLKELNPDLPNVIPDVASANEAEAA